MPLAAGGTISLAVGGAFALETSGSIIATNFIADGVIQTTTNITNGKDPIKNYDVVGGVVSGLTNPAVASGIDGTLNLTAEEGFTVNSPEVAATNAVVGGVLGRAFGDIVESVQKTGSEAFSAVTNFVTNLFTEANKAVATDLVDEVKEDVVEQ